MKFSINFLKKPFIKKAFLLLTALLFLQSQDLGTSTVVEERPARRPFSRDL
jgi:hypothetical protein